MVPSWSLVLCLAAGAGARGDGTFWQVTDIHVDDEGECSGARFDNGSHLFGSFDYGHYGCGASMEAVNATAAFMNATQKPDFVFFTGDVPWSDSGIDVHEKLRESLQSRAGPDVPVFFLLGNHDFNGHVPHGDAVKAWYATIAAEWGKWLDPAAKAEFASLGYYSTPMPGSNRTRLVALNTEHFNHGTPSVAAGDTAVAAAAQLAWLNATLADCEAKDLTAVILGHVPPVRIFGVCVRIIVITRTLAFREWRQAT